MRRHRVESVAPMVFLEAALRENCAQTYATVCRFCYECVPFAGPPPAPPSALRAPADDVSGSLDSLRGAPRVWSAGLTTPLYNRQWLDASHPANCGCRSTPADAKPR